MKNLFLKKKPCAVLLLLKDSQQQWYPSKLARASNSSYVHTVNLLAPLRAFGIITSERKGKQNIIRLTEKGAYLAQSLDDFSKKCDSNEQDAKKQPEPQHTASPMPKSQDKPLPSEKK